MIFIFFYVYIYNVDLRALKSLFNPLIGPFEYDFQFTFLSNQILLPLGLHPSFYKYIKKFEAKKIVPVSYTEAPTRSKLKKDLESLNALNKGGFYWIFNNVNGKHYVGSSVLFERRIFEYLKPSYLKKKSSQNSLISKAMIKHGYSNFVIVILEIYGDQSLCLSDYKTKFIDREDALIKIVKNFGNCYNIQDFSSRVRRPAGYTFSDETKLKMSEVWDEERKKNLISRSSLPKSEETKLKIIEIRKLYLNKIANDLDLKEFNRIKRSHKILLYENNVLVKSFDSLSEAADKLHKNHKTINKHIKEGTLLKDKYIVKKEEGQSNLKIYKIGLFYSDGKLYTEFNTMADLVREYNSSHQTINKYIESGELWRDKYYIKRVN
uniref:Orf378 n=1 Tax=Rhizophydium sp. 136 TaxID=60187 RepID=Q950P2_9FUNG|nr:orf378 [Rhizophydium sp. 136]AAK84266.1 orf378 [Rhizophydium sp. 136]